MNKVATMEANIELEKACSSTVDDSNKENETRRGGALVRAELEKINEPLKEEVTEEAIHVELTELGKGGGHDEHDDVEGIIDLELEKEGWDDRRFKGEIDGIPVKHCDVKVGFFFIVILFFHITNFYCTLYIRYLG